jgi:succinate dehydrogenase / fumarate reductase membrane anchor subunit
MVKKVTTDMSLTANGLHDWLIQRFSALVLAIYFLVLVSFFLLHPTLDFSTWQGFFAHRWMQVATLIVLYSYMYG